MNWSSLRQCPAVRLYTVNVLELATTGVLVLAAGLGVRAAFGVLAAWTLIRFGLGSWLLGVEVRFPRGSIGGS